MLLFCAKTIVKESRNLTTPSEEEEEEEEEKHFGRLVTFWFGILQCFLVPLGVFIVMKTLEDKR